jgi:serine/threonine-protein kinase
MERLVVPALVATIGLIVWAGAWYYRRGARLIMAPLQPLMRLDLDLGIDTSPNSERRGANAILSPDGTQLVYVSHSKLFTRRLDQVSATELPGTEGALAPFFSPDGQWVAFFSAGLKKISLQDGRVVALCKCGSGTAGGGSWGEDGNIVAAVDLLGLSRIPEAGGTPVPLTEIAAGEIVHRWPQILPGGKAVLFSAYTSLSGLDGATIQVLGLKDGRRKTLVRGGTWARYLASGHLVYIDKGTLYAVPFDPDRLDVRGTPTPVLENVAYSAALGSAQIDFSRTGSLVYRSSLGGGGLVTVQWLDELGRTQPLLPVPGNYLSPTLSPDGSRLALTSAGDVWVYELGRGSMTQLTFGGGYGNPLWTPDGRYIVFRGSKGMWWTRANGIGQPQPLFVSENHLIPWSFTADGKRLAFDEVDPKTGGDLWTVSVDTGDSGLRAGKPEVFLQTRFNERCPRFSPDGRWIAYQSDESGDGYQVYVQAFPDGHSKRRVSTATGTYPSWSRNGHELFFRQNRPENQLMAASYHTRGDSFFAEKPHVWYDKRIITFASTSSYDPAPNGNRIVALMTVEAPQESQAHAIFLLNFFDELRRRVPSSSN